MLGTFVLLYVYIFSFCSLWVSCSLELGTVLCNDKNDKIFCKMLNSIVCVRMTGLIMNERINEWNFEDFRGKL